MANYFKKLTLSVIIAILTAPGLVYAESRSTLFFSSDSELIINREARVAVKIKTGEFAINAVRTIIHFDPELVEIKGIETADSVCDPSLFVEKIVDNKNGRVIISCGKPTPGFIGEGVVAQLVFRPKIRGKLGLSFAYDSQALANDGYGTETLGQIQNSVYQIR